MKAKKTEIITFKARSKYGFDTQPRPYPASAAIPQWWKELTPYEKEPQNPDGKKFILKDRVSNASAKKCQPMLDGLTSGYIISLWADVMVTQGIPFPSIAWRTYVDMFQLHGPTSRLIPPPLGYDQVVFKYINTWIPKTPPGYSVLITSPFGYNDLPFHAIPAVVDTDRAVQELVFPMWIKSGLEGVVENGTPLVQIIPFKRTNWKAEFDYYEDIEYRKEEERHFNRTLINNYIKNEWSKKDYK